ncbi:MAG: hypothetical protein ACUZ8I_02250 [Candidatus Scalindua sp.]
MDNVVCKDFSSVMIYSITYIIIKGYLPDVSFRREEVPLVDLPPD